MSIKHFTGNFTQQEPLSEQAIKRASEVLQTGRLHRYNVTEDEISETALLEQEFAESIGSRYCLACTSGGYALHITLRAMDLAPDEPVLTNAFTLSPVPGAIHNAGGVPLLVETTQDLVIDLNDLEQKAKHSDARILLLSHMRGHIVDMDRIAELVEKHNLLLLEDCAHTMGAFWGDNPSGSHGTAACFSTQTYKHINSGEGGLVVSDDAALMAKAIVLSGSYMLFDRHQSRPPETAFADIKLSTPNLSGRMDNLRASLIRSQLPHLPDNCERWNTLYQTLALQLANQDFIYIPARAPQERFVGSSFQFLIQSFSAADAEHFVAQCQKHGVELKWFGAVQPRGYTSTYRSWRYFAVEELPVTDSVMQALFDLRLPLTFSVDDVALIGEIIVATAQEIVT